MGNDSIATRGIPDVLKGLKEDNFLSATFFTDVDIGPDGTKITAATGNHADISITIMVVVLLNQFFNLQDGDSPAQPGAIRSLADLDRVRRDCFPFLLRKNGIATIVIHVIIVIGVLAHSKPFL
eukprot:CAMPEP_0116082434 /NCGR_PEP_ID=MMETSP0327-20121206/2732_1 /TAXON_ID=44447 /ORGANISM="Pseudo-nitzschia delicatissima, Strain B596" /LENGTH=123 /DNA_ID=CAMNT_0003573243 /DNA_START=400 /DNA_END=771 /DNA_ORIENTATION=-